MQSNAVGTPSDLCPLVFIRGFLLHPYGSGITESSPTGQLASRWFFDSVQGGLSGNVHQQALDVEAGGGEGLPQAVQKVRAVGEHRLFDNLMEELLDETI